MDWHYLLQRIFLDQGLNPGLLHCRQILYCLGSVVKNPTAKKEMWIRSLGQEDPLEKGMAVHSSTLPWRIPWTEEPGGLQSMGLQRTEPHLANKQQQSVTNYCFINSSPVTSDSFKIQTL